MLSDPLIAQWLGIATVDSSARGSTATYTVRTVDATGNRAGIYAVSPPTALTPYPLPVAPAGLRAVVSREAIALFWSGPANDRLNLATAVSYEVFRRDGNRSVSMTEDPVLRLSSDGGDAELPGFLHEKPPVETTLRYTVVARDIFGRRSVESAPLEVFYPDFSALDPPVTVVSSSSDGRAVITWDAPKNPNRKGWRVDRAIQPFAIGEPLTPRPLTGNSFTDTGGRPGTTYYYQITAVNKRDELGEPKVSQAVVIRSGKKPTRPAGLTAEARTGRVMLSWDAAPGSGAVYQVERSLDGREWHLLTSTASAANRFEDVYSKEAGGEFHYRVVAWSAEDIASDPSAVVIVRLPDVTPPLAPQITSFDGSDGKVRIDFVAGGGPGDAAHFHVLRSSRYIDPGVVVSASPLPASATSFVDERTEAGATYFYRLIAIDAAGNRSEPSEPPVVVRVGDPTLPSPPAPRLRFEPRPFPRVIVEFPASGHSSVRYALQRQDAAGRWIDVQGPFPPDATSAGDPNPPRSRSVSYRLVTISASGSPGGHSSPVAIDIP
jgi:fibronectin type 3 domain-containing protein